MSTEYQMLKYLFRKCKPSWLSDFSKAEAALRDWNNRAKRPYRIDNKNILNCCIKRRGQGGYFRGARSKASVDAAMLDLVLREADTATAGKKRGGKDECSSQFQLLTCSNCPECTAFLQIGVISKIMHRSSAFEPDWAAESAEGGALHPSGVSPLAALHLYLAAVSKSLGDDLTGTSRWEMMHAIATVLGEDAAGAFVNQSFQEYCSTAKHQDIPKSAVRTVQAPTPRATAADSSTALTHAAKRGGSSNKVTLRTNSSSSSSKRHRKQQQQQQQQEDTMETKAKESMAELEVQRTPPAALQQQQQKQKQRSRDQQVQSYKLAPDPELPQQKCLKTVPVNSFSGHSSGASTADMTASSTSAAAAATATAIAAIKMAKSSSSTVSSSSGGSSAGHNTALQTAASTSNNKKRKRDAGAQQQLSSSSASSSSSQRSPTLLAGGSAAAAAAQRGMALPSSSSSRSSISSAASKGTSVPPSRGARADGASASKSSSKTIVVSKGTSSSSSVAQQQSGSGSTHGSVLAGRGRDESTATLGTTSTAGSATGNTTAAVVRMASSKKSAGEAADNSNSSGSSSSGSSSSKHTQGV
eukprot:14820-Heterococcus_DN1.PRE.6